MRKFLLFVSIICLLALVGCAAIPATTPLLPTQTATPESTATATTVPTLTATPSLPKPKRSDLQPVNNVSEVLENGTWVTKNADGKVTATWNTTENAWDYNAENLQMVYGGATKPNSELGRDSRIPSEIIFNVPDIWKTPLSEVQKDPHPLVSLGVINQLNSTETDEFNETIHYTIVEIGVDYRGIALAEPAGDGKSILNRYVAGFTVSDPNHPDMMYTISVPITEDDTIYSNFDLNPNGSTTDIGVLTDKNDPDLHTSMNAKYLIKVLQDPSTIGRRFVLELSIPIEGQKSVPADYADPNNKTFFDAFASGKPIPDIETSLTAQFIRVPRDLDLNLTKK